MARKIINPQQPPILWSTVKETIDDINANFEEVYNTVISGGQGIQGIQGASGGQGIPRHTRDPGA